MTKSLQVAGTDFKFLGDDKPVLTLVDGYGFVFRAYHSLPPLTRSDGTPVGAVYGFSNMLLKLLQDHVGDALAVVLDAGAKTFRNEIYDQYKANRPPPPEDLIPQFPLVREAVEALNLPVLEQKGFEADDLIATYTRLAKEQGYRVVIVSSDKDLMQLVDDDVRMYDAMKSKVITAIQVEEKFGVGPDKVLDVLSLMGDSSDNVPGVPGIGPKTAAELIRNFGSLESVLERAGEVKQNKRRESLISYKDDAILSKKLISLCDTVDVAVAVEDLRKRKSDYAKMMDFFKAQDFKALQTRIGKLVAAEGSSAGGGAGEIADTSKISTILKPMVQIASLDDLKQRLETIGEIAAIAICAHDGDLRMPSSVALDVYEASELFVIDFVVLAQSSSQAVQGDLFGAFEASKKTDVKPDLHSSINELGDVLKPWLQDLATMVIGHDIKPLLVSWARQGNAVNAVHDVMVQSYVLDGVSQSHDLPSMASRILDVDPQGLQWQAPKGKAKTVLSDEQKAAKLQALANQVSVLHGIHSVLQARLMTEQKLALYERIERPLVGVLAQTEAYGVKVSAKALAAMSDDFAKRLLTLEHDIHELSGEEFNIGSPKQLGEVLFDRLGLPGGKKSKKTGAYSTGADVLEELEAQGHRVAGKILQWRQLSKLKSTYSDALPQQIQSDGRIHTHFQMAVTSTGRLSSNHPNLQNIPIRTEEGNKIREAFVPEPGNKLISADYSQIELRLLAHLANIEVLQEAFRRNEDIHATTASQIFGVAKEAVDGELRRKAKMINFGIIYGMSAFGLAQRLGIERSEAKEYIEAYFKQYPGIRKFMEGSKEFARAHGYIETLWGRRCYIKDINDKNPMKRQFAERAAINAPLQGTAADIIKKAMVRMPKALENAGLQAKMILQVHDELLFEVPNNQAQAVADCVKEVMEQVMYISVPMTVEVNVGGNWAEIH